MKKNKQDIFKKLLVAKKSKIKAEVQLKIIDNLFDVFLYFRPSKTMLYISEGRISQIPSRKTFETIAYYHLVSEFEGVEIKSYNEEKDRYKWNIKISEIYDVLVSENAYDLVSYESDLFADRQIVSKNDLTKTITITTNKLHIKEIKEPNMKKDDYLEIVRDYKQHFPNFDEVLKLIIDMRLAKNRKASFLYLRVKSDWGKSFFSGLLQNLQIGLEIDYHNLMNKSANNIAPIQVRNSFVLLLDEFNNFSSDMKKLSHSFIFAAKFGMAEKVELYLKILLSAEKSPSFSGAVDDQIVNRVMVMDMSSDRVMKLTDRPIYNKHGNDKYMSALERYAYLKLTKYLKEYLEMDRFEAHRKADNEVRKMLEKYKMRDVSNLNEATKSVINEMIAEILESDEMSIRPKFKDIKSNIIKITTGAYTGKVFIRQPKKTIETILKHSVSEGELKKMKYKISDLESILNILSTKPYKIDKKTLKGVVIDIEEVEEKKELSYTVTSMKSRVKNHLDDIPKDF